MIRRANSLSPEVIKYFEESIKRPPGSVETIESISIAVESELGWLFEVVREDKILAAVVLSVEANTEGKDFLNVNLLGGEDLYSWRDEFWEFIVKLLEETNTQLSFISRAGWQKIFPGLKVIGSWYTI